MKNLLKKDIDFKFDSNCVAPFKKYINTKAKISAELVRSYEVACPLCNRYTYSQFAHPLRNIMYYNASSPNQRKANFFAQESALYTALAKRSSKTLSTPLILLIEYSLALLRSSITRKAKNMPFNELIIWAFAFILRTLELIKLRGILAVKIKRPAHKIVSAPLK